MWPVNILADFANRDIRLIAGIYSRYHQRQHFLLLLKWLTASAYLCRDHVVIPWSFVTECRLLLGALTEIRELLPTGLVKFSSRDSDYAELVRRRREQYRYQEEHYPDLYDRRLDEVGSKLDVTLIERNSTTSADIAKEWRERSDDAPIWSAMLRSIDHKTIDRMRLVPEQLSAGGRAVLWHHFQSVFALPTEQIRQTRRLLNRDLFLSYEKEYHLAMLRNLPGMVRISRGLNEGTECDMELLQAYIGSKLFQCIERLSPEEIIIVRQSPQHAQLMDAYQREVVATSGDRWAIARRRAAKMPAVDKSAIRFLDAVGARTSQPSLRRKLLISALDAACDATQTGLGARGNRMATRMTGIDVAIFAALQMEAEILARSLALEKHDYNMWMGKVGGASTVLFQADTMGRVAGAVATAKLFQSFAPKLIIVAGSQEALRRRGCFLDISLLLGTSSIWQ